MTADPASILRGPEPELPPQPAVNGHIPRYDLGKVMRMELPAPTAFRGLVYQQKMHTLSGPPEAGKTVTALWIALQAMKAGNNILFMDEETGARQVGDLLRSMGADAELIDKHLYYTQFLDLPWKGDDIRHLHELVADFKPKLSIFDSAGELLSAAGIDENSPSDVTRFYKQVLHPVCAKHKSAVMLIDHDAKDSGGGKGPSRYARGTTAKLASPHVALKVQVIRPFSRVDDGVMSLYVAKDRLGSLHRYYNVRVHHSPLDLEFIKTTAADLPVPGGSGLSPAAEKLFAVVDEQQRDVADLTDRVNTVYGHGLKRETASRALNGLADQGLIDRFDLGHGRSVLWAKRGGGLIAPPGDHAADL